MAIAFVILVMLVLVGVLASKRRRPAPIPATVISLSQENAPKPEAPLGTPREVKPGTWLLNPDFGFELNVYPITRSIAHELVGLLNEAVSSSDYRLAARLAALVARHNIRCREIDLYVAEFGPTYRTRINELIAGAAEWTDASERDREDLLAGYREKALAAVRVRPDVDLITLFDDEPADRTVDDRLIDAFGFDDVTIYLRHASKLGKVHTIEADNYRRPFFERLVERGLAIRGKDLPLAAVLEGLKLKEMQGLVADLDAPIFRRKAQSIEFLLSVPDISRRLDAVVSFRELFQLKPLPPPFDKIDLEVVAAAWKYDSVIAELLQRTYVMGFYDARNRRDDVSGYVKHWKISSCIDAHSCPYCRSLDNKTFPGAKKPRTPMHLACRCTVMKAD